MIAMNLKNTLLRSVFKKTSLSRETWIKRDDDLREEKKTHSNSMTEWYWVIFVAIYGREQ